MAHAYAPGLTVTPSTIYRTERRLPLKGRVERALGDVVKAEDRVAYTELPGAVFPVNAAHKLSCPPKDVVEAMLLPEGSKVETGQVVGRYASFFGLFKHELRSPLTGTVEAVSKVTGQVMFRAAPVPVILNAFVDGKVSEIFADEGVAIESQAAYIQGIFGIGGETQGLLKLAVSSSSQVLDEGSLPPDIEGKILVGGSLVTLGAIRKAAKQKARGIIAGGIHDQDLRELLGYDLGVAITGGENLGITVILTEGFGSIPMANRTYGLLKEREGSKTSICGATQIRAGVMRPEIVIPLTTEAVVRVSTKDKGLMEIGAQIRLIRQPYFGEIAKVLSLPVELQPVESEAKVRVVEVELTSGRKVTIPRANVELIED